MHHNEYRGLSYTLRGNQNPCGRSRIFYLCHKEEHEQYFQEICADIFASQGSAVIWYATEESGNLDTKEYYDDLLEMNLFVAVITRRFLDAVENGEIKEYHFAKKNHIPILPLIQESGLFEDFNRICGEQQTLYKHAPFDPTEIPYGEKLKDFLETTLFPDEFINELKEAFDAYIFLSYRKKDRYFAQDAMKKIHHADKLRKIAIWYDEYLVPGENFNDSIKEALHKSELFVLVVTPNIVNEENYVKNVEYPMANELEKKIIPIEEVPTNREDLKKGFQNIPKLQSAAEVSELTDYLSDIVDELPQKEHKDEAKQDYLLGMSYQLGIDVERDQEYALILLERAMEKGSEEAYRHMVGMYRYGHHVERNLAKAKELQQRLLSLLEKRKSECKQNGDAYMYLRALQHLFNGWFVLGDIEREMNDIYHSVKYLQKMLSVSEEISRCMEHDIPKALKSDVEDGAIKYNYVKTFLKPLNYRNHIRCLMLKGKASETPGDGIEAFLQAGELSEEYYDVIVEMKQNATELMTDYGTKELDRAIEDAKALLLGTKGSAVSIAAAAKELTTARALFDSYRELLDKLFPMNHSLFVRMSLSSLYNEMGDLENECGDATNAYHNYLDSEALLSQINEEQPTLPSLRNHFFVCRNLCMFLFECSGDWVKDVGKEFALKAVSLMERVLSEKNIKEYLFDYGMSLVLAAGFSKQQRSFQEVDDYLMRATQAIMESGEDDSFIEDFMDLVAPDESEDDGYTAPKKTE